MEIRVANACRNFGRLKAHSHQRRGGPLSQPDVMCYHSIRFMRRWCAFLAVATVIVWVLSPFSVALQAASIPACCLRAGKHHCTTRVPGGEGFLAGESRCPYSLPVILPGTSGLHSAKTNFVPLQIIAYVTDTAACSGYQVETRAWSPRGPPASL